MFETILTAVDSSDSTDTVIGVVVGFAEKAGSKVEVVHVHEHESHPARLGMSVDLETKAEATQIVDRVVEKLKERGVDAHGWLLEAHVADVAKRIVDAANESGADLIVVGRRRLSNLEDTLLGSVSNKVVHLSHVPVLIAAM
ncbi:MAG TPA: universal stress protein [Candidatus Saccharimonadales bacterium]|nr:universal stress protein [Candidatus Saccharimonadales bacterium]